MQPFVSLPPALELFEYAYLSSCCCELISQGTPATIAKHPFREAISEREIASPSHRRVREDKSGLFL